MTRQFCPWPYLFDYARAPYFFADNYVSGRRRPLTFWTEPGYFIFSRQVLICVKLWDCMLSDELRSLARLKASIADSHRFAFLDAMPIL